MKRLFCLVATFAIASPLFATRGSVFTPAGEPVAGVTIEVFEPQSSRVALDNLVTGKTQTPIATTKTSSDGAFSFDTKSDGLVVLSTHADGYAPIRAFVAAADDDIVLTLPRVEMKTGTVRSANGPVAGATILAIDSMGDVAATFQTDEHGRYSIPDPKRWATGLCLRDRNYAESCHWSTEMRRGQSMSLDFTADAGSVVKGHVVGTNGKPVPDARVRGARYDVIATDDTGAFTIRVAKDVKLIRATAEELIGSAPVAASDVTIPLTAGHSIFGFVRDEAGHPLKGSLAIVGEADRWSTTIVNGKGEYTIAPLDAANYNVYVRAGDEYETDQVAADLRKKQSVRADITAKRSTLVRGVVRDEQKHPVAGAKVMLLGPQMPVAYAFGALYEPSAMTSAEGTFKLHLQQATGHLVALKPGFAAGNSDELKAETLHKPVTITLPAGISVSGKVVDANDQPVSGAGIIVMRAEKTLGTMPIAMAMSTGAVEEWIHTDATGAFTLHLNRGLHDLGVWKRGYSSKDVGAVEVSESTAPLRIKLEPAAQIRGRVQRKNGKPVDGGIVYAIEQSQKGVGQGEVSSSGDFTIDSIQPGTYLLQYGVQGRPAGTKTVNAPASDVVIELPEIVSLHGTVVDKATGAPIRQFSVDVNSAMDSFDNSDINDPAGHFTREVSAGPAQLTIRAEGYVTARQTLTIVEGKAPEALNIALVKGRKITGRVTTAEGRGIQGVSVDSESEISEVETDDDGEFEIPAAPVHDLTLNFQKSGLLKATKAVAAGTTDQRVTVAMASGRKVTGHVMDKNGAPVEDAQISAASEAEGADYQSGTSDRSGAFTIEGLGDATYTFTATKNGMGRAKIADVDVAKTQPLLLTLGSDVTGTIHGTVAGAANSGWMYAMVTAAGESDSANAQVNRDGTFVVENVPAGEVRVSARLMSMQRQSTTKTVKVNVPAGGDVEVQLAPAGDVTVKGTVRVSGAPAAGANVAFSGTNSDGQWWNTTTRGDGTYEVSGLAPGHYSVSVSDAASSSGYSTETDIASTTTYDINITRVVIEGHVVDERGLPIEQAKITARPVATKHQSDVEASSDGTGAFAVTVQGDSGFTVSAVKKGYAIASADVAAGSSGPVVLTLHSGQGARVRLIDGRTGATLKGYVVVRDANGTQLPTSGDQESDGVLSLPLPQGTYKVSASASEYASNTVNLTVPSADAPIVLTRGGTLVVQSHDDANELIRLVMPNGDEYVRCYCNGIAEIRLTGALTKVDHVASGTFRMEVVDAHNVTKRSIPVTITEGQTTTVDVTK